MEYPKDEEYLDKEFPKGKTKFRGQAMVLIALARQKGKQQVLRNISKILKRFKDKDIYTGRIVKFEIENRLKELAGVNHSSNSILETPNSKQNLNTLKGLCKCGHTREEHSWNNVYKELTCLISLCPCEKFEVEELAGVKGK